MLNFDGKIAVITGGSRGIGLATSLLMARGGATVYAVSRTPPAEMHERVEWVRGDVCSVGVASSLRDRIMERSKHLDILVHNAGMDELMFVHEMTEDHLDRLWAVNVKAPILWTKTLLQALSLSGSAALVNVASSAAKTGSEGHTGYVATKHALLGFTRSAARELYPLGIRVNAVCPGITDTAMPTAFFESYAARTGGTSDSIIRGILERSVDKRMATPHEVAEIICFLASSSSQHVIGQAVNVDGGILAF